MFTACVDQSCQAVIASVVIDQNLLRTMGTAVLQNPYVNVREVSCYCGSCDERMMYK